METQDRLLLPLLLLILLLYLKVNVERASVSVPINNMKKVCHSPRVSSYVFMFSPPPIMEAPAHFYWGH